MARRAAKARAAPPDPAALVRELGLLLDELGLTEAEVSVGEVRVRVQRQPAPTSPALPVPGVTVTATTEDPATGRAEAAATRPLRTVEAPMVGTFYRASSPTAAPYVQVGDVVKPGQTLGIIEAMKLMNEIEATVGGRVVEILVENGQGVEFGQPLVLIDPAG